MRRLLLSLAIAAVVGITPTQEAQPANIAESQRAYERAVDAFDKDNLVQATALLKKALTLSPDNKQALKLKEVIDSMLRPEPMSENGEAGPGWAYYDGENRLENRPEFLHIPEGESSTTDNAYAMVPLRFPVDTLRFDVEFKLKVGQGSVPVGVTLLADDAALLTLQGTDEIEFASAGQQVYSRSNGGGWDSYRISWFAGEATLTVNENVVAKTVCKAVPQMLVFGSPTNTPGRQTEAWFEWLGTSYNIAATPEALVKLGVQK